MSLRSHVWNARTLITRSHIFAPVGNVALRALSWALRRNPIQRHRRRVREATYLNAGCGKKARSGYINLDHTWQPGVDLVWDLKWRLPFRDGSLKGIYTEHCLEHLPFRLVVDHVLTEFHRILVPGGWLRLIVPDAGLYLKLYAQAIADPTTKFPNPDHRLITPMMYVNQCFRDHGHLYAYDFDTFRDLLLEARFSKIECCSFMVGADPALLLDSPERSSESLYIEAMK
jgi:predicted SAM-dependent methyltransferase